jgi:hypothetical protein
MRAWARFCGKCGADLSGAAAMPRDPAERAALLEQVRAAAGEVYEVLGEMPWAGGGGIVYFALEKESRRLVRLRLQPATEGMALGETRSMVPLDRLSARYVSEASLPAVPRLSAPPAAAGQPAVPPVVATGPSRRVGLVVGVFIAIAILAVLVVLLT